MTDYYSTFEPTHWKVHLWRKGDETITVLHDEPFRLKWFATQLVTFVYLIEQTPDCYQSILEDYNQLRQFAGDNKQTFLPFGFQCGYALLPIYLGTDFSESLITDIQNQYRKRWCVFYAPSLFDIRNRELHQLKAPSFWGCVYRSYINDSIQDIAGCLRATSQITHSVCG